MKPGAGKRKGSAFERWACRALSLWVSENKQEDVFWRSAMSGGRSTVAHTKGKRLAAQSGDISCIHPIGHNFASLFHIECKFYKDLDYASLLTNQGKLLAFWQHADMESKRYGKLPFMIVKQNRIPEMICICDRGRVLLGMRNRVFNLASPKHNLYIINAEDFFKICTPPRS